MVVANPTGEPQVGTGLPLAPATVIGRAATSTIRLEDSFASNEHAHITWRQGQWWLEDQRSRNGTLLNGIPVQEGVVLSAGDLIEIGSVLLRFEQHGSGAEAMQITHLKD
ncbi:MAG: FHA domain-containing protein [Anaerolineae bacterium]|nr:FHA domain-containing protein [Anaerolineae bacterium]